MGYHKTISKDSDLGGIMDLFVQNEDNPTDDQPEKTPPHQGGYQAYRQIKFNIGVNTGKIHLTNV
jgi:hypothetical protein